jgi:hypothetical protein
VYKPSGASYLRPGRAPDVWIEPDHKDVCISLKKYLLQFSNQILNLKRHPKFPAPKSPDVHRETLRSHDVTVNLIPGSFPFLSPQNGAPLTPKGGTKIHKSSYMVTLCDPKVPLGGFGGFSRELPFRSSILQLLLQV